MFSILKYSSKLTLWIHSLWKLWAGIFLSVHCLCFPLACLFVCVETYKFSYIKPMSSMTWNIISHIFSFKKCISQYVCLLRSFFFKMRIICFHGLSVNSGVVYMHAVCASKLLLNFSAENCEVIINKCLFYICLVISLYYNFN